MTAASGLTLADARADREFWGRLVESAVGAHLVNAAVVSRYGVYYWRDRNREVDFVVSAGRNLTAIEVKSGRKRDTLRGMAAFADAFTPTRKLLVGGDGIPVEEFLLSPVEHWVE
jgi:predicted AAA+ superfamily ATPase